MVPLNHGNRPSCLEQIFHLFQGTGWIREVLEEETEKDVIKGRRGEREMIDIPLLENHIFYVFFPDTPLGTTKGF